MSMDGDYTKGELEEFLRGLPFMPEKGEPLPEYVYRELKPEFISAVMKPPVTDYGRVLEGRVALDTALFLKGGNFGIIEKLEESGWSSDSIGYDAKIRHEPTNTEWDIEVWTHFDWRKPETYSEGYIVFLPTGRKIAEEVVVDRRLVSAARWEVMPEEDWGKDTFDLTSKGGEEASRVIEESV